MKFWMIFVALLSLAGLATSKSPHSKCPHACNKIYKPVCGRQPNGRGDWTYRLFPNRCMMDNDTECNDENWERVEYNKCLSVSER